MKEIESIGNLPKCFQMMAKEIQGIRSTRFYECENAKEVEDLAKNKKCEELTCVMDPSTNRGFLGGFSFQDASIALINQEGKDSMVQMELYFTEIDEDSFKKYSKMLDGHRKEQEKDMQRRRANKKAQSQIIKPGEEND